MAGKKANYERTTAQEKVRLIAERELFVASLMRRRTWNTVAALELEQRWKLTGSQIRKIAAVAHKIAIGCYAEVKPEDLKAELSAFLDEIGRQALNEGNPTTITTVKTTVEETEKGPRPVTVQNTVTRKNPDYHSAVASASEFAKLHGLHAPTVATITLDDQLGKVLDALRQEVGDEAFERVAGRLLAARAGTEGTGGQEQ